MNSSQIKIINLSKIAHQVSSPDALLMYLNRPTAVNGGDQEKIWKGGKIPRTMEFLAFLSKDEIESITLNAILRAEFIRSTQTPITLLDFVNFLRSKGFLGMFTKRALVKFIESKSVMVNKPTYSGPSLAMQQLGRAATLQDIYKALDEEKKEKENG